MSRRMMIIGVVLCLVALGGFLAWPIWERMNAKEVSRALQERTKALVEKNPELKPAWEKAMSDGKLTLTEAKEIVEKAGEKIGANEE